MPKRFQSLKMEKLPKSWTSLLPDWQRGSKKKKRNFFSKWAKFGQPNLTVCFTTYCIIMRVSLLDGESHSGGLPLMMSPWLCSPIDTSRNTLLLIHLSKAPWYQDSGNSICKNQSVFKNLRCVAQWWTSSEGHLFRQWKLILNSYWILLKVACHECLIKD